jgi:hypothetical protein
MTDAENASTALDQLDARGRQAAASLRSAVDDLMADAPPIPLDSVVVDLRDAPRRRRRGWLVAAAVLLVAGLATAVLLRQTHDEEGTIADDNPTYLVARSVPNGWDLVEVRVLRAEDFPPVMDVTTSVYGDTGRDDPWSGPLLTVYESEGVLVDQAGAGGEPIEVAGHPGTIDESSGTVDLRMVTEDSTVMIAAGDGMDRAAVIAAAEGLAGGDLAGAVPQGMELLARGPGSAAVPFGSFALDGLSMLYGGSSSDEGQLGVLQRAGDADDAELLRASPLTEVTEVHGQPAYSVDGTLQWYEPSIGVVVTVLSVGGVVDDAQLLAFADGMEPGRPGEVDEIVKAHSASGPFGRLEPGEVVVVEGEPGADGEPDWQLVASDDGDEGFGLTFADGGGSTGVGVSGDEGWGSLSIDVANHSEAIEGGRVGVFGAVAPEAVEVVIEAPGREPIRFEVHQVEGIEGWDAPVFAGLVPVDLGQADVAVRAADGTEIERMSWSPDEGSSQGSTTATVVDGGSVSSDEAVEVDGMSSDSAEASGNSGG